VLKSTYIALVAALTASLLAPGVADAQDDAKASGGFKIGVVDFRYLLTAYNKRKTEYDKLQKEVDDLQKGIDGIANEVEKLKGQYDAQVDKMSSTERRALEEKIEGLAADFRAELAKRQRLVDRKEKQVVETLITDIRAVVEEIAVTENYHLILDANSPNPPRGGVLYYSKTLDITPKVEARLNKTP